MFGLSAPIIPGKAVEITDETPLFIDA